jgi:CO dehydrogenase nickel-insertion accessory protein CooC1
LWGARQVRATLEKLRLDRQVIILNRMDLPEPAASDTPVAALFVLCGRLQIEPQHILIVDHDHRRANLLRILGFKSAVLMNPGGHTRKLITAGLLAEKDLESMGLFQLKCFTELIPLLQAPRRAFD